MEESGQIWHWGVPPLPCLPSAWHLLHSQGLHRDIDGNGSHFCFRFLEWRRVIHSPNHPLTGSLWLFRPAHFWVSFPPWFGTEASGNHASAKTPLNLEGCCLSPFFGSFFCWRPVTPSLGRGPSDPAWGDARGRPLGGAAPPRARVCTPRRGGGNAGLELRYLRQKRLKRTACRWGKLGNRGKKGDKALFRIWKNVWSTVMYVS